MTAATDRRQLRVRDATPDDAGAIAALLVAAFAEFEPRYTPAGYRATTPTADEIRRRLPLGPTWVVECDGAVIGTVSALSTIDGVYVRSMAVEPQSRGRGTGQALLSRVERFATGLRARRLFLSTTPFLTAAIRMYERAGFRVTEEGPKALGGTPLVTMVKSLGETTP
jgi:GNAT superfamily N-acetyltransferase